MVRVPDDTLTDNELAAAERRAQQAYRDHYPMPRLIPRPVLRPTADTHPGPFVRSTARRIT